MNAAVLPDVSRTDQACAPAALDWVGMQGIDLPVTVAEPGYRRQLHAHADVLVDLPLPRAKGIHMSRLYRLLGTFAGKPLTPAGLHRLLGAMIDSHRDCQSRNARLHLQLPLLLSRPALVSSGLTGWKSYPVSVDATLVRGVFRVRLSVTVTYSSTCPCSAALSRQLIEQAFLQDFAGQEQLGRAAVAQWLRQHATLATPHSQRSEARVSVDADRNGEHLGVIDLIDRVEAALATPVQTMVRRADEQAFAALNGQNLMFVEDAARRIRDALQKRFPDPSIQVRHMESLHPHDAVARITSADDRLTD